jgi:hypothetical protein
LSTGEVSDGYSFYFLMLTLIVNAMLVTLSEWRTKAYEI